jgi:hypothetical protein
VARIYQYVRGFRHDGGWNSEQAEAVVCEQLAATFTCQLCIVEVLSADRDAIFGDIIGTVYTQQLKVFRNLAELDLHQNWFFRIFGAGQVSA